MYNVTNTFLSNVKLPTRSINVKATIGTGIELVADDIISFSIDTTIGSSDVFTIGSVNTAKLTLKIVSNSKIPLSIVGIPICPYVSINSEWVKLGTFYADMDSIKKTEQSVSIECFDVITKQAEQEYATNITFPTDTITLAKDLQRYVDFKDIAQISSRKVVGFKDKVTVRAVLSELALLSASNCISDRDGKIVFLKPSNTNFALDANNYIDFNLESDNDIKISKLAVGKDKENIECGDNTGKTISFKSDNVIDSTTLKAIYDLQFPYSYVPYSLKLQGMPHLDCGDIITLTDIKNVVRSLCIVTSKLQFNGGLISEFSCKAPSSSSSESAVGGSMIAQLNKARVDIIEVQEALIGKASIDELKANNAVIESLKSKDAEIDKALIGKADINDLTASNITFGTASGGVLSLQSLLSQFISGTNAQLINLTSANATFAEGIIGNAQISNLDVAKLNAGMLDTTKILIAGTNNRLLIRGNRLQVFATKADNSLYERVSLGDVNGDGSVYGFRVRGADGTTVLLDETGVKREGITDGSINNAKIAGDANISGTKLDINSVVTAINGSTTTISGSKVLLNGQTLDVQFNTITRTVNDIQIGGRNLLYNSGNFKDTNNWSIPSNAFAVKVNEDGTLAITKIADVSTTHAGVNLVSSLVVGQQYTVTICLKSSTVCNLGLSLEDTSLNFVRTFNCNFTNADTYYTVSQTFTASSMEAAVIRLALTSTALTLNQTITIKYSKLEQGNKATDWTPAPEDIQTQIDSQTTQVSANTTAITLKLDSQTFTSYKNNNDTNINNINTTLNKATTDISALQGQIVLKVSQVDIDNSINKVVVGIRNLFRNSGNFKDTTYWFQGVGGGSGYSFGIENDPIKGNVLKFTKGNPTGWYVVGQDFRQYSKYIFDTTKEYTLSFDAKIDTPAQVYVSLRDGDSTNVVGNGGAFNVITSWQRFSFTFKPSGNYNGTVLYLTHDSGGNILWLTNVSLTEGNKNGGWTPAPEDTQNQIDSATTRISTAEGSIKELKDSIVLKVSQTDIDRSISKIQIGGRNLLLNSTGNLITSYWQSGIISELKYNFQSFRISNSTSKESSYGSNRISLKPNTTYTVSFYVTGDSNIVSADMFVLCRKVNSANAFDYIYSRTNLIPSSSDFDYIVWQFTTAADVQDGYIRLDNNGTKTTDVQSNVWFSRIKVEEGNKATTWTPAVEDVQGQLDSATTRISTAEGSINVLKDAIDLKVSTSDFTNGNINLVSDGSFENDGIGWGIGGTIVTDGHLGSKSLKFTSKDGKALNRPITVIPGNKYRVSYWYKTSADNNGTIDNQKLRIGKWSDGTLLAALLTNGVATTWTQSTMDWVVPDGITSILLGVGTNLTVGSIQFDDISFVDITAIDGLTTRITDAEQRIKPDSIISTVTSSQTYKSDLNGKLDTSTYSTTMQQLSDKISSKVEKNEFGSLITQYADKVQIAFGYVGNGQNLVHNGNATFGTNNWVGDSVVGVSFGTGNIAGKTCFFLSNSTATEHFVYQNAIPVKPKTNYTLSFLYYTDSVNTMDCYAIGTTTPTLVNTYIHRALGTGNNKSPWQKVTYTFTTNSDEKYIFLRFDNNGASGSAAYYSVAFTDVKLEEGDKATPFCLANDEMNNTSVVMDNTGLSVNNGALQVKRKDGTTVLSVDTNGVNTIGTFLQYNSETKAKSVEIANNQLKFYDYQTDLGDSNLVGGMYSTIFQDITDNHSRAGLFLGGTVLRNHPIDIGWIDEDGGCFTAIQIDPAESVVSNTKTYGSNKRQGTIGIRDSVAIWPGYPITFMANNFETGNNGRVCTISTTEKNDLVANLRGAGDGIIVGYGPVDDYHYYTSLTYIAKFFGNAIDFYAPFNCHSSKNRVVTTSYGDVALGAYETPTPSFGDYGRGTIGENGTVKIIIDPIMLECGNTTIDYDVFVSPYAEGVVYVNIKEMTPQYFIVHGTPGLEFAYEYKVKQKGFENDRFKRIPKNI